MRICDRCNREVTPYEQVTHDCWRSSQNQTVASGVEGAHEGTTADKYGAREPEKLNNAQRFAYVDDSSGTTFILRLGTHDVIIGWRGRDGYKDIADIKAAFDSVALAESSLSSPPPEFRHSEICLWWHRRPCNRNCLSTFRQSSSPSESGAESAHSGKQNTADKSELLPTQIPKEK